MSTDRRTRCFGGPEDPLMLRYHDEEWGIPLHDDQRLFELLLLEGFQAGLSWRTILHKRENFRKAFDGFDPAKIAHYGEKDRRRLLADPGIVRNSRKIEAAIENARSFLKVREEHGSFDRYIWQFTAYTTLRRPGLLSWRDVPSSTSESDAMAKDLKTRGFRFAGTTICYAFMQTTGMVNDHHVSCFLAPPGPVPSGISTTPATGVT